MDNKTVASVRAQVRKFLTSTPTTRIGRDGKQYPAKRESRGCFPLKDADPLDRLPGHPSLFGKAGIGAPIQKVG